MTEDEYDWRHDDAYPIPRCPECDERDAIQLSTGEWVCQACTEVFDDDRELSTT